MKDIIDQLEKINTSILLKMTGPEKEKVEESLKKSLSDVIDLYKKNDINQVCSDKDVEQIKSIKNICLDIQKNYLRIQNSGEAISSDVVEMLNTVVKDVLWEPCGSVDYMMNPDGEWAPAPPVKKRMMNPVGDWDLPPPLKKKGPS